MTFRHRVWVFAAAGAVVLVTTACGKTPPPAVPQPQPQSAPQPQPQPQPPLPPPKPARTRLTLAATADSNPDASGRPSPVVVRVYQLKTDAAFTAAEFFALFDDDMKVLGPALIGRNEYVLAPSERRTMELDVSADAQFVGVIAAYRDVRNAQWRTILQAPLTAPDVTIAVERARVVLSVPK
jgi:type VI secretion system protein VasD